MAFRGASAETAVALSDQLETLSQGFSGGSDTERLARIGDDLFAVAAVLRSEKGLRRVATELSVPAEAKAGLLTQVFGDKVDEGSLSLIVTAAQRRWTLTRDLADALEHLGVVATVRSAGTDAGRLADELFSFGETIKANPELRDALSDPARSVEDKRALVRGLLQDKALPATVKLVEQSLAGTHRTVGVALHEYSQVASEVYGEGVATVRVANDLSDTQRTRLNAELARQYGHPVHLNVVVDPSVVGGVRVDIGDDVIDGTMVNRLDDARRQLAG